ncbi:PD40 domain-containing protein [Microvirga sp. 3-52]|uniref:TolB family protein n=1 Tax=Microvirga sp. 3-52 TaxID=2792425 RepID=UPI001ACD4C24|nr:PD40 domain-containing protein [Microvirga sp. 3-52]MBO1903631.1 PD40 domain-containing protein [Microvirga sp. 3-52]MBS7450778.1 PD40 domain-containing protein [Microvirga sp. 3-52]
MFLSVLSVFKPTSADIQTRISTAVDRTEGLGESRNAQFSPDGRFVVFESKSDLVAGDVDYVDDIYLKDLTTGAITHLSGGLNGEEANGRSLNAQFSPDGRYVVFSSAANNLVIGNTNGKEDIFRKDLTDGTITRLSVAANKTQANGDSYEACFSPDGRFVVFISHAFNLVAGNPSLSQIYLKDLSDGTIIRLSASAPQTKHRQTAMAQTSVSVRTGAS